MNGSAASGVSHIWNSIDSAGRSILQAAIADRDWPLAERIIQYPIDVNHQDRQGYTALAYAIQHKNDALSSAIVELNPRLDLVDRDGNIDLWHAIMWLPHNKQLIGKMVELGSNLNHRNKSGKSIYDLAEIRGVNLDLVDK